MSSALSTPSLLSALVGIPAKGAPSLHNLETRPQEAWRALRRTAMPSLLAERHVQVLLCAACSLLNYADRVNMSVCIIPMAEHYNWTHDHQAAVMSAFFFGYLPMQLGGALLCRRFGAKRVLGYGALLWSLFTFYTPAAANQSFRVLLMCRVGMGLSEGVAFPSCFHYLACWVPASERGRAVSTFLVGVHIGTTIALVLSPRIIAAHSWQLVFHIFGAAGALWIALWVVLASDRDGYVELPALAATASPANITSGASMHATDADNADPRKPAHAARASMSRSVMTALSSPASARSQGQARVTRPVSCDKIVGSGWLGVVSQHVDTMEKRNDGLKNALVASVASRRCLPISWLLSAISRKELLAIRFILSSPPCLAVCFTQFTMSFCHYVILSWLPTYFGKVFQVETAGLWFTCVPYAATAVCANFGGFGADFLASRGMPLTRVRKLVTTTAFTGMTIFLLCFTAARSVMAGVVLITTALSFLSIVTGGFESSYLDMASPEMVGTFKSVGNTLGALSGMLAMPYTSIMLRVVGGSWRLVFASLGLFFVMGIVVFIGFSSSERVLVEQQVHDDARDGVHV